MVASASVCSDESGRRKKAGLLAMKDLMSHWVALYGAITLLQMEICS